MSRFTNKHIHFIGIGGCGMSGLARMLLDAGAIVSGTDAKPGEHTAELASHGARIAHLQDGRLLEKTTDLVVRTAAIPESNPEYQRALALNLPQMKYAELLGQVMAERLGVAISGTHGKSTTTGMTSYALLQCGADPSYVIGGRVPQLGGSSRSGQGKSFVVEACEFDRSFHKLHPKIAVITNIEADHLDCYTGGIDEIVQSFRDFVARLPDDGLIIANGQDAHVASAVAGSRPRIDRVGLETVDSLTWCSRVVGIDNGRYRAEVYHHRRPVAMLNLSIAGRHNLFNATAAIAACHACGVSPDQAAQAIGRFTGVERRMAELGQYRGATVVDDYGHHPTEIRTTLRALRERYQPRRLVCVFQPHQYSRTRFLLDDFARSFEDADMAIIPDIYAVRDTDADKRAVTTQDLVDRIRQNGQRAVHLPELAQIVAYLRAEAVDGDLVVTMGAGNVCSVGHDLLKQ